MVFFFEKNPCHFLGIWYNEGRGWRYSSAGMSVRLTRERSWVRAPLSPLGSHTGTVLYLINPLWGRGSAGRASRSQREGRGFESLRLQEIKRNKRYEKNSDCIGVFCYNEGRYYTRSNESLGFPSFRSILQPSQIRSRMVCMDKSTDAISSAQRFNSFRISVSCSISCLYFN